MAEHCSNAEILVKIQDVYIPFLKKLLDYLKKKNESDEKLQKLKAIYDVFTTAAIPEQIQCYNSNKNKLERWHEIYKGIKVKRNVTSEDAESSQDVPDTSNPAKKSKSDSANQQTSTTSTTGVKIIVPSSTTTTTPQLIPAANIKKEKVEPVLSQKVVGMPQKPYNVVNPTLHPILQPKPRKDGEKTVFHCASCQFNTTDDAEFMKHARSDHRTDLSMWCKHCGRCFSNAGVLVAHIKENNCTKEDMIYRCGVKECTFETVSGQTFVHHLRHCHKGSPFIFCVHCQKIFTLPHCLILHMQDDCPYKERNRRSGVVTVSSTVNTPPPTPPPTTPAVVKNPVPVTKTVGRSAGRPPLTSAGNRPAAPQAPATPVPAVQSSSVSREGTAIRGTAFRGRGRGRGRSRGRGRLRVHMSDSSDSEDPDDPSWRPEEGLGATKLRRSARWAKKVNDVVNPELHVNGEDTPRKKSFTAADVSTKKLLNCPCCDFMAALQSVLEDHYIADHKSANRNACLVCNVKFETTRLFLDHFPKLHSSDGASKNDSENATEEGNNPSSSMMSKDESDESSTNDTGLVLESVTNYKFFDLSDLSKLKIPYQSAIQERKDKLKKFEDLKSTSDIAVMLSPDRLSDFFKCIMFSCTYTSHKLDFFVAHITSEHEGKRMYCAYCLREYFSGQLLAEHMLERHHQRKYQCSGCFYRAYSRIHVQNHIKKVHGDGADKEVLVCPAVRASVDLPPPKSPDGESTIWPYVCGQEDCKFQCFNTYEFQMHIENVHRTAVIFYCYYCKVDFASFKRLLKHYNIHGINTYQCVYCIHGCGTQDEALVHLCNTHPDYPLKAGVRMVGKNSEPRERAVVNVTPKVQVVNSEAKNMTDVEMKDDDDECSQVSLYDVRGMKNYPKQIRNMNHDLFCGVPFCGEQVKDLASYFSHLKNVHTALNVMCPYCPNASESVEDFRNHLICHGPNLYACSSDDCLYYRWDPEEVKKHVQKCSGGSKVAIRESKTEEDQNEIKAIKTMSMENISSGDFRISFTCMFCSYKSSSQSEMKNHLFKELAYIRFHCTLCSARFYRRKETVEHFQVVHPGRNIKCMIRISAEVDYIVKKLLNLEVQPKIEACKCQNCSKQFKSSLELQQHLYFCLCKEYRPYDCNYCECQFADPRILKSHTGEKHYLKPLSFSVATNPFVEEEIDKYLLRHRLKFLKVFLKEQQALRGVKDTAYKLEYKFYKCMCCSFAANFRSNVQKHIQENHSGESPLKIEKVTKDLKSPQNYFPRNTEKSVDQSPESFVCSDAETNRYHCSFCIKKKACTLKELVKHIEFEHPVEDKIEYDIYFWPEEMSSDDKEIYKCGYCNTIKGKYQYLKDHCRSKHSDMPFKIRDVVIRNIDTTRRVSCWYCYKRVIFEDLNNHTTVSHPKEEDKAIDNFYTFGLKTGSNTGELPYERIQFGGNILLCSHCGAVFASTEEVNAHSNKAHPRVGVQYDKIFEKFSKTNVYEDAKFLRCEFCSFVGERQSLENHLTKKHRMRVTCRYCRRRFEFATKLKEHHDEAHEGKPVKYRQQTVAEGNSETIAQFSDDENDDDEMPPKLEKLTDPEDFESHYKKVMSDPDHDSELGVSMTTREGQIIHVPIYYLKQALQLFPKVMVEDCKTNELKTS